MKDFCCSSGEEREQIQTPSFWSERNNYIWQQTPVVWIPCCGHTHPKRAKAAPTDTKHSGGRLAACEEITVTRGKPWRRLQLFQTILTPGGCKDSYITLSNKLPLRNYRPETSPFQFSDEGLHFPPRLSSPSTMPRAPISQPWAPPTQPRTAAGHTDHPQKRVTQSPLNWDLGKPVTNEKNLSFA